MSEWLQFSERNEFREWLHKNHAESEGIWLLFGKSGGPVTLKASEALEEALCFGWIDGQMRRLDDHRYIKYFVQRRDNSAWSEKNKALVTELAQRGLLTEPGRNKVEEAHRNGQWSIAKNPGPTAEQVADLSQLLSNYPEAHANFRGMSPSVQKTYTRAYCDAKTEAGRQKRLAWMVDRLN